DSCFDSFLGLIIFINCYNVRWATRVQDVLTLSKVIALIVIIIAGLVHIGLGHTEHFENAFEGTNTEPGYIALAFYSGIFSYAGWNYLNFVTEEMKEPYRIFFVGAREGHLPSCLAMINLYRYTPESSLIFLGLLSLAYLTTVQVYTLINYTAFSEALFVMFSVSGMLWMRIKYPHLERPIKLNILVPIVFLLICGFLVFLPFYVNPWDTGMSLVLTLSGVPVYYLTVKWEKKPLLYRRIIEGITYFTQKLLVCVGQEKHE
ncbi:Y+L amino acid transporter 1-like, partial [Limulus polyphemus]|uniref:Y+L amino acid transporter 1-like n=1 Tax=Limulus polyphemus TaxID=6850 RepID=A0ABM1RW03_LIMPO